MWAEDIWAKHPSLAKRNSEDLVRDAIAQATENLGSKHDYEFIDSCYSNGGKWFVEAVEQYGCNEDGEPIRLTPWYRELLEVLGDFRVTQTYCDGASQIGKSLAHTLLLAACLTEGKLDPLWSYDTERSRDILVPSNIRPVLEGWLERRGVEQRSADKSNNSLFQVSGVTAQFVFVSTTATNAKSRQGLATAAGTNVGVSRDIVFNEEKSQSRPGTRDPLLRRMDAGRLPSHPVRDLGTPGSGLGIEHDIKTAQHHFYPHYRCDKCDRIYPLDPKGCLLRAAKIQTVTGEARESYLSVSGRPIQMQENGVPKSYWWHTDPNNPIESAYFGCYNCGHPIRAEQRTNAWYQCRKTGVTLREFLDSLPKAVPQRRLTVGITISPLLRVEEINTAGVIVEEGLNTKNSDDWQQQRLGCSSESANDGLTIEILKRSIVAPRPARVPDTVIAGGDQGRAEHWLWINEIYYPLGWQRMPIEQIFEQSIRVCRFGSDIHKDQILNVTQAHGVKFGIFDNEPDIDWAGKFCKISGFEMADQRSQLDAIVEGTVSTGGDKFPCWKIRNSKFLKAVRNAFLTTIDGEPIYRLPTAWEKWEGNLTNDLNPLKHLLSPQYDPATDRWTRSDDHVDDLYYAAMFAEVALYLYLQRNPAPKRYSISGVEGRGVDRAISAI
jgi:hypothetical protein